MSRTYEGETDEQGIVRLPDDVRLPRARRVLVTILEDEAIPNETALLSEEALEDWNRPEEDAAWAHLQPAR